jgi:RNA polymerase sigma-70 factor (ECF subfamily)
VATRAPDYALEGESGDRERYLVLAHQAGDPFAFPEIVKDHYASLLGHAIRRTGDQRAAEDAVQDALLRAYKGLDAFGGDYKLGAWLHRILDNCCTDVVARRLRDAKAAERFEAYVDTTSPAVDEDVADHLAAASVRYAVAALPNRYREALLLRDVLDMEYSDVADHIGITEENARARVSRARAALRKLVGPTVLVWAVIMRVFRRGSGTATRIGAKLTNFVTGAAGQAATTASQAGTAAATVPPDVLAAPTRLAPAIGTLAATAVAAVASVGIPAIVSSSHSAPSPPQASLQAVQVSSGPAVSGVNTTIVSKPLATAATEATTTTTAPATTTTTIPARSTTTDPTRVSTTPPAAAPIALQPGAALPQSNVIGTLLDVMAMNLGQEQEVVGTAQLTWLAQTRDGHLDVILNPTGVECSSYFGGTLTWLEDPKPAVQGDVSFSGWLTGQYKVPGGTAYDFSASMTASGPQTFTGSGWLTGELKITSKGVSLEATGWSPAQGAPAFGPGSCADVPSTPSAPLKTAPQSTTTSSTSTTSTTVSAAG